MWLRSWLLFAMLSIALPMSAGETANGQGHAEDELRGIVADNTVSRVGHDFARYFADYHSSQYGNEVYNLAVHERPSARWGSLIWITSGHQTYYRRFLQPTTSGLKEAAEGAVEQVHEAIRRQRIENMFLDTFDMDRDEF